jgi:predicted metal-dependent phosphoesterase TrpH
MRLDLHMHSTASDGACGPAEVVSLAAKGGLDVIALADHDTVAGIPAARVAAEAYSLQVVSAMEVSSTRGSQDLHILGYFFDPDDEGIRAHDDRAGRMREVRMQEMIDRLVDQGHEVTMDGVIAIAGPDRSSLGRPHLAQALIDCGAVRSHNEAFGRLIGDGMPAHVPTRMLDPVEAITLIRSAGGLAIWAHPPLEFVPRILSELANEGLHGLEVYRPRSRPEDVRLLERQAERKGLLKTGGSDWHGPNRGSDLGDFFVTSDEISDFLEAGGL